MRDDDETSECGPRRWSPAPIVREAELTLEDGTAVWREGSCGTS